MSDGEVVNAATIRHGYLPNGLGSDLTSSLATTQPSFLVHIDIMTALVESPRHGWLQRETPLGVPAFTPLRVRTSSENCYFQIDGFIVRMVYLGGLSEDDPSALAWTLRATPRAEFSGIEFLTGWRSQPPKAMLADIQPCTTLNNLGSHQEALASIERTTGFSRRQMTEWLQTSHTTLNGIANSSRTPRCVLASRIANFSRLVARLEAIYGDDQETIRRSLTTEPANGRSALQYVLDDNYEQAATAAQHALHPPRYFKPVRGATFHDSPMIAVEDI